MILEPFDMGHTSEDGLSASMLWSMPYEPVCLA